jgi:hypothetical protein
MSVPGITRATVVVLALTVAGVPVARRLCGLTCEAIPDRPQTADAARAPHCAAHPPPSGPSTPEPGPNPCGHGHGGDGALLTASAGLAKSQARSLDVPAAPGVAASDPARAVPCARLTDVDRRQGLPPPAARHSILRL